MLVFRTISIHLLYFLASGLYENFTWLLANVYEKKNRIVFCLLTLLSMEKGTAGNWLKQVIHQVKHSSSHVVFELQPAISFHCSTLNSLIGFRKSSFTLSLRADSFVHGMLLNGQSKCWLPLEASLFQL